MPQVTLEHAIAVALQHHKSGQLDEAESIYRQVLSQSPQHVDSLYLLGSLMIQRGQPGPAIELLQCAARANPHYAEVQMALGNAYSDEENFESAVACFTHAVQLKPGYFDAYHNLGNSLSNLGRYEAAAAAYRAALQLKPDLAETHKSLAVLLLLLGDYEQGLGEYEWRWLAPSFSSPRHHFLQPVWRGEPLHGRTILLDAEQGFGDTIQFVRYAAKVVALGGKAIVGCPPELCQIVRTAPGVSQVFSAGPLPHFDVHISMLSLPLVFGTRVETIPGECPYLTPDPGLVETWRSRIHSLSRALAKPIRPDRTDNFGLPTENPGNCSPPTIESKLKVGLAWAGGPTHKDDRRRSLHLEQLAGLSSVTGAQFFSLQKGAPALQALQSPRGMELIDFTSDLNDFSQTAALIANLDLVISVDTAVAHIAGALAKPVWILLPYKLDWRWLTNRDDSPWYPTARLFRQKTVGSWEARSRVWWKR